MEQLTPTSIDERLNTILPEQYQNVYEDIEPVSMGTAALKYDAEGKVAWGEIWGSFCNLAMAGGPPHKGKLLEPASEAEVAASLQRYRDVVQEACRGIRLATDLAVDRSDSPGWIQMFCHSETMAEWMVRAIVVENVSARLAGTSVMLPAGPSYRIGKEIKNIVTVVAKTSHYWAHHMSRQQQLSIGNLFLRLNAVFPLLEPAFAGHGYDPVQHAAVAAQIAAPVTNSTGWPTAHQSYPGWIGFVCPSVKAAVWMMRALVVTNVLSRREETTLYVPVDLYHDPDGSRVAKRFIDIHTIAETRGVL